MLQRDVQKTPYFEEIHEPSRKHWRRGDVTACDLPSADQTAFLKSEAYKDALAVYKEAHARCVALQEVYRRAAVSYTHLRAHETRRHL
eukprot:3195636-Prorocentrum_lima.AAC.1